MPSRFFDTSALVKYYVEEAGSAWVTRLVTESGARNYIAYITGVEMTAALARRGLTNSLRRFESDYANGFRRIALPEGTVEKARSLSKLRRLRGYDAIQLASAQALADALGAQRIEFICADDELIRAAQALGLPVDNPHLHP